MRILKLTPGVERKLLAARVSHDQEAQAVAARIIADVRKRGDAALLAWTKELDQADLTANDLWISQKGNSRRGAPGQPRFSARRAASRP